MDEVGTVILSHNIVSPLGFTSTENYEAVKEGKSALKRYEGKWGISHPFVASLIQRDLVEEACRREGIHGEYTYFEKIAILSISKALCTCSVDAASSRTLFVISTTKGNVDLLRSRTSGIPQNRELLGTVAKTVAEYFSNKNQPLVVSNACVSGLHAQIIALRMLQIGLYDNVIVCGVEEQSSFIMSGFLSLMVLSDEECRPFDEERIGINLGEAAATIIYSQRQGFAGNWIAVGGAVRNDAFHISNPSHTGEGCFRCLKEIKKLTAIEDLAFINAHGTATLYNDEMEATAIHRAGLNEVPVNSLKGYFGHTMGAAGVLETIISMLAVEDGTILGTRGYANLGVSKHLQLSSSHRPTYKQSFIKLMSGFGGCNAAMLFKRKGYKVQ